MIKICIKDILNKQGKSKYWFIKNMEGGYQSISKLMNNETCGIRFETLEKTCNVLQCDIKDVLKCTKEEKNNE